LFFFFFFCSSFGLDGRTIPFEKKGELVSLFLSPFHPILNTNLYLFFFSFIQVSI
jgi:hypothetical protein